MEFRTRAEAWRWWSRSVGIMRRNEETRLSWWATPILFSLSYTAFFFAWHYAQKSGTPSE